MNYWLLKTEPSVFSIDDLASAPAKTAFWDGVRNYQARNWLRDTMRKGDLALLYHSSTDPAGIAGIVTITSAGYPDATAFDTKHHHYDPKSTRGAPTWYGVDVKLKRKLPRVITLAELKGQPQLADMQLLKRGNRLSVMPVAATHWEIIQTLLPR